ncbi:DoxX family protein [Rugosimonospora africana]|uniref:DoxX family protein n=1 Tax=Rugosimonospora africana TaxID=556532 RepID=A0A8J3QS12_9ACTN|nr:hypothetical protein [Rugosimonospora africana]GIH14812.1 hypothetical protein Raf01_29840 [Rugosimonospora africana]
MTASTAPVDDSPAASRTSEPGVPTLRRLHGAAVVRVVFGIIWSIDATFKWLPGFIHGQTLGKELGAADDIHTPVIHQWISLWHSVGTAQPTAFAVGTAVIETLIAVCMILGLFSPVVFVGSAIFSFGIWSAAEGFHLPWTKSGITDLGPSVGYIAASLALYFAAAGATWSVDSWLRPRLGRLAWLTSVSPAQLERGAQG